MVEREANGRTRKQSDQPVGRRLSGVWLRSFPGPAPKNDRRPLEIQTGSDRLISWASFLPERPALSSTNLPSLGQWNLMGVLPRRSTNRNVELTVLRDNSNDRANRRTAP